MVYRCYTPRMPGSRNVRKYAHFVKSIATNAVQFVCWATNKLCIYTYRVIRQHSKVEWARTPSGLNKRIRFTRRKFVSIKILSCLRRTSTNVNNIPFETSTIGENKRCLKSTGETSGCRLFLRKYIVTNFVYYTDNGRLINCKNRKSKNFDEISFKNS